MNDITYNIQRKTQKAEKQTKKWLQDNGLNNDYFADIELHLAQAQKIATNILKNHAKLLGQNEAHTLNNFLQAIKNRKKRAKITATQAYRVMNIGNAVNRKLFKAYKAIK
jgi:hypothetical protein